MLILIPSSSALIPIVSLWFGWNYPYCACPPHVNVTHFCLHSRQRKTYINTKVTDTKEEENKKFGAQRAEEVRRNIWRYAATTVFCWQHRRKYGSFLFWYPWKIRQLMWKWFIPLHAMTGSLYLAKLEPLIRLMLIWLKKFRTRKHGQCFLIDVTLLNPPSPLLMQRLTCDLGKKLLHTTLHAAKTESGCVHSRLASVSSFCMSEQCNPQRWFVFLKKNGVMCCKKTVPLPLPHILLPSTCALPGLRASSCADSVDQLTGDFWDRSHCWNHSPQSAAILFLSCFSLL